MANKDRPDDITIILLSNQQKLLRFLTEFKVEKADKGTGTGTGTSGVANAAIETSAYKALRFNLMAWHSPSVQGRR